MVLPVHFLFHEILHLPLRNETLLCLRPDAKFAWCIVSESLVFHQGFAGLAGKGSHFPARWKPDLPCFVRYQFPVVQRRPLWWIAHLALLVLDHQLLTAERFPNECKEAMDFRSELTPLQHPARHAGFVC